MSEIILKGKGVWFTHPETGEKIPLSFPLNRGLSDKFNHFHFNPHTHMPFEGIQHRWGPEAIAHKTALDMVKQNHPAAMGGYGNALAFARKQLNSATRAFNAKRPGMRPVPIPFVETNGGVPTPEVHAHYKANHYGVYQVKATPADERQTHDQQGRLVTMHANNKTGKLGRHPETMAFPQFYEYGRLMDANGVRTVMGTQPHIEPQHIVMDDRGNSPLKRYSSFARDPHGDSSSMGSHSRMEMDGSRHYPPANPSSAMGMLPQRFFVPSTRGAPPAKIVRILADRFRLPETLAAQMARTPFAQLAVPGGRGSGGAKTQLNKLTTQMKDVLEANHGQRNHDAFLRHRDHIKHDPHWHGSTDQMHKLREVLGLAILSQELGPAGDLNRLIPGKADEDIMRGWGQYAIQTRGELQPFSLEESGFATEDHASTAGSREPMKTSHLHHDFPPHVSVADGYVPTGGPPDEAGVEAGVRPLDVDPELGLREAAGLPFGIGASEMAREQRSAPLLRSDEDPMDAVMRVFENVQLAEARQNPLITKDTERHTVEHLAHTFGLEKRDVEGINATMGHWTHIAEGFQVKPHVVGVVKAALSRREE